MEMSFCAEVDGSTPSLGAPSLGSGQLTPLLRLLMIPGHRFTEKVFRCTAIFLLKKI